MKIPGPNHPWRTLGRNQEKLAEARREAKRRYERSEIHLEAARDSRRRRKGIPPTLPLMKSWDWAKGKVKDPCAPPESSPSTL